MSIDPRALEAEIARLKLANKSPQPFSSTLMTEKQRFGPVVPPKPRKSPERDGATDSPPTAGNAPPPPPLPSGGPPPPPPPMPGTANAPALPSYSATKGSSAPAYARAGVGSTYDSTSRLPQQQQIPGAPNYGSIAAAAAAAAAMGKQLRPPGSGVRPGGIASRITDVLAASGRQPTTSNDRSASPSFGSRSTAVTSSAPSIPSQQGYSNNRSESPSFGSRSTVVTSAPSIPSQQGYSNNRSASPSFGSRSTAPSIPSQQGYSNNRAASPSFGSRSTAPSNPLQQGYSNDRSASPSFGSRSTAISSAPSIPSQQGYSNNRSASPPFTNRPTAGAAVTSQSGYSLKLQQPAYTKAAAEEDFPPPPPPEQLNPPPVSQPMPTVHGFSKPSEKPQPSQPPYHFSRPSFTPVFTATQPGSNHYAYGRIKGGVQEREPPPPPYPQSNSNPVKSSSLIPNSTRPSDDPRPSASVESVQPKSTNNTPRSTPYTPASASVLDTTQGSNLYESLYDAGHSRTFSPSPTPSNGTSIDGSHLYAKIGSPKPQKKEKKAEAQVDALTDLLVQEMSGTSQTDYFGLCFACGQKVIGDRRGCRAMDHVYHVSCFTCTVCAQELQGRPFYAVDGLPYCEKDYLDRLEKCTECDKPIMDRILRATGRPYHPRCFKCVVCYKCLDGIPFTVDSANQIHCIEDFHNRFAPRCTVCQQPIVPQPGEEETLRIVALDRSFHVNCYKCEDCDLLLSSEENGRGCYPLDGHILCKVCNGKRVRALTEGMNGSRAPVPSRT
ncbi:unnamed protein product [Cyprideis torosa]|uniref:Uncharacterized protein n=1 Tax=Cyprideis torosa TaxID=163714 RepID=A0A7R8WAU9_9CRUS|nr:unnamed protein product [Cyprideis torosa]CAG0891450.1 unnamed protein product [Cyprideis torosa]